MNGLSLKREPFAIAPEGGGTSGDGLRVRQGPRGIIDRLQGAEALITQRNGAGRPLSAAVPAALRTSGQGGASGWRDGGCHTLLRKRPGQMMPRAVAF